jgi:nucleoid DNA-binding protein
MEQEIKGIYDLTELAKDVWGEVNSDFDTQPTQEDLAYIRIVVKAFFAAMATRLAQGYAAHFDDCGTFTLKLRKGREVQNFQTGERFEMPDYLEVEFNAGKHLEDLIRGIISPPAHDVK